MNKMDNLINEIDNSAIVKDLKKVQDKVYKDEKLCELLEKYKDNPSEELKNKILSNSVFQEYKIKETDLNLFIMEINKRFKEIKEKGSCVHENN